MKHFLFALCILFAFSANAQKTKTTKAKKSNQAKKEVVIPQPVQAPTVTATPVQAPTNTVPANSAPAAPEFVMSKPKSKAKMTFESLTLDYGTIAQSSDPVRYIKFTNTGTEPLVISNARSSCGCTVPKWPTEPIAPGQSSTMEVRYATERPGKISKAITITTNEGEDHIIQVVGEVLPKVEATPVPPAQNNIIKGN
jgi:hypothetical protein